ncbi:tetratricopeptide repeat protein [bacterium]|nr:tetratricopeptide repeat protein [bacterium]
MAEPYYLKGITHFQKRQFDLAYSNYTKAIELDSKYCDAYKGRGSVLRELGKYNESISDYNKAIELNPNESFT